MFQQINKTKHLLKQNNLYYIIFRIIFPIVVGILVLIGITYARFTYKDTTTTNNIIAGGALKLLIDEDPIIVSSDMYPTESITGIETGNKYKFSLSGYNDSDNDIYYGIYLNQGDDILGKVRLKDSDIMMVLKETIDGVTRTVYGPSSVESFNNALIYANTVKNNTLKTDIVKVDYELTTWVSEKVLITNDNTDVVGRSVYSQEDYKNSYSNFNVTVEGDFINKTTSSGIVSIEAITKSDNVAYNTSLDYDKTPFINDNVIVNFIITKEPSLLIITNELDNTKEEVVPAKNNGNWIYQKEESIGGKYKCHVVYKDNSESDIFYYNVRIDKNNPAFNMSAGSDIKVNGINSTATISNVITNISDDNKLNIKYAVVNMGDVPTNYKSINTNESSYTIKENLKSGLYQLYVIATDEAGKTYEEHVNYRIGYDIELIASVDNTQNLTAHTVYLGQKFNYSANLPTPDITGYNFIGWYSNKEFNYKIDNDSIVTKEIQNLYAKFNQTVTYISAPSRNDVCKSNVYNGFEQVLTNAEGRGYTFFDNRGTNAGNYNVTISLNGGYVWNDSTTENKIVTCTINKKNIEVAKLSYTPITKIYDTSTNVSSGFKITPTVVSGMIAGDQLNVSYTTAKYNDANVANANAIDIVGIALSGAKANNYTLNKTSYTVNNATISKKAVVLELSTKETSYTGSAISANAAVVTPSSGGTITYKYYSNSACNDTPLSQIPINPGNYGVIATISETSNYLGDSTTCIAHTIKSNTATIPTATDYCNANIYDGAEKTLVKNPGTGYTFSDTKKINAGSYTIKATLLNGYKWNDNTSNTKTLTCSIEKRAINVTAGSKSKVYDGIALTNSACTGDNLAGSETVACTMTSGSTITSVGSATNTISTAVIKNGTTDVSANYTITKKTGTLTVTRANIATASATDKYYNGSAQTGVNGNYVTWTGTQTETAYGTYTATATPDGNHAWSDGTITPKAFTWHMKDNLKPTASFSTNGNSCVAAKTATTKVTLSDEGSGVKLAKYLWTTRDSDIIASQFTGSLSGTLTTGTTLTTPSNLNGEFYLYIYVEDNAGNSQVIKSNCFNVGTQVPLSDVITSPTESTTGNVTLTINPYSPTLLYDNGYVSIETRDWLGPDFEKASTPSTYAGKKFRISGAVHKISAVDDTLTTSLGVSYKYDNAGTSAPTWKAPSGNNKVLSTIASGYVSMSNELEIESTYLKDLQPWIQINIALNTTGYSVEYKDIRYEFFDYTKISNVTVNDGTTTSSVTMTNGSGSYKASKNGTYKFTLTDIYGNTSEKSVTVSNISAVNPTIAAYNGTYDGSSHTISVSGGSGGTIQYSTDNSTWSTTKPTRTTVGTTTVYVRVLGDSGHNTTSSISAKITVNQQQVKAPTNLVVSSLGIVTWTASSNATSYQISIDGTNWANATSGINYFNTIIASTGSRKIYVKSINSDTVNYKSPSESINVAVSVYALSFISNSTTMGTVSTASYNVISGETYSTSSSTLTLQDGRKVTATAKTGYSLNKWSITSGTISASSTITATFAVNSYAITLDNQSATIAGTTSVMATYNTALISIILPTKTGYTFGGYYTATNGEGTQYYTASGTSAQNWNLTANTTLYAKWTVNPYAITYNANLFSTVPKTKSGVTVLYFEGNSNVTLNGVAPESIEFEYSGDKTFVAGEKYNITLTYVSGNYVLDSTESASKLKFVTDIYKDWKTPMVVDGAIVRNYLDLQLPTSTATTTTGTLTVSEDGSNIGTTLFNWIWYGGTLGCTFNNYVMKVNITKVEIKTLNYGSELGTLPIPFKQSYVFDGWYTAESGGSRISSTTTVPGDITYYAHWKPGVVEYTENHYFQSDDLKPAVSYTNSYTNTSSGIVGTSITSIMLGRLNFKTPEAITKYLSPNKKDNVIDYYYDKTCYGEYCAYIEAGTPLGAGLSNESTQDAINNNTDSDVSKYEKVYASNLTNDTGEALDKDNYRIASKSTSAQPYNYVCFGTTTDCQNENFLYRIIGSFSNQVRLISKKKFGKTYWYGSGSTAKYYSNSNLVSKVDAIETNANYGYNSYINETTTWDSLLVARSINSLNGTSLNSQNAKYFLEGEGEYPLNAEDVTYNVKNKKILPISAADYLLASGLPTASFPVNTFYNLMDVSTSWINLVDDSLNVLPEWSIHNYNSTRALVIEFGLLCSGASGESTCTSSGYYSTNTTYQNYYRPNIQLTEDTLFCGGSGSTTSPIILGYGTCPNS